MSARLLHLGTRTHDPLAMQKVEGSNLFIRSKEAPRKRGVFASHPNVVPGAKPL